MFEIAELGLKLKKVEFAREEPSLRTELLRLQREIARASVPVVILIHGIDGSGRGDVLNLLHEWLDARFLLTFAPSEPTEEEQQRPEYWRFWRDLPRKGGIGVAREYLQIVHVLYPSPRLWRRMGIFGCPS